MWTTASQPPSRERGAHGGRVADVAAHEGHVRGDRRRVPAREVVEDRHVVAARREARDDDAADVAGAAGDEDAHAAMLSGGGRGGPRRARA